MRIFYSCILSLGVWLSSVSWSLSTPLDDYVNKPDPHYSYKLIDTFRGPDYTLYTLNMTSQKWKSDDVVTHPIWWHYLSVTIPDEVELKNTAFLFIDGGSNHDKPPKPTDNFVSLITMFAVGTKSIGANLKMIPNQPVVFKKDPTQKSRSEDSIIAWTWKTFIENTTDPEILLRMPMTKAAVRALDTITDFAGKTANITPSKFMVAGASKRGWTTWTTGAVDKRVFAIAPIVLDVLNFVKNLHHFYRALGGWTFAFNSYYELNFTDQLDNPNTQLMADIIDPISYNDRLTMPKLVISTGGDEFFLPDDSHYYFNQLSEPKYMRILPNAEHSCAGHEISLFFTLRAFYLSIVKGWTFPKVSWKRETLSSGGRITVMTDTTPMTIHAYKAKTLDGLSVLRRTQENFTFTMAASIMEEETGQSPGETHDNPRDFRLLVGTPGNPTKPFPHPVPWLTFDVQEVGNNMYQVEFDNPAEGWAAFFIQMTFPGADGTALEMTTEAQIIPDTFPFPECHGHSCRGTLV